MTTLREDFVETDFEAPTSQLEQAVANILADVLSVDRIGRSDSFYDFNGTSLQAIQICARIERQLGIRAQPSWLFTNDLLESFVAQLSTRQEVAA